MFYKQQELETFMENVGKSADQKQELKKGFYTGGAEDLLPRHHIDEDDFRRKWRNGVFPKWIENSLNSGNSGNLINH